MREHKRYHGLREASEAQLREYMVNHDYRNIKIDASTTVTIDLEDIKKQLAEDFYRSQGLWL